MIPPLLITGRQGRKALGGIIGTDPSAMSNQRKLDGMRRRCNQCQVLKSAELWGYRS
ncbi:MAG: hypothetical protein OEN50_13190 [Deltaproteobacteria bacterium]|nr:hypothetical protein [Deltaproteobacteria bacterium]